MIDVKIRTEEGVQIPEYATEGAAGFDLRAKAEVTLAPGETKVVPTGIYLEIPVGYELQVRPRSGTSLKTKLRIANSPGTIDSDYRGEVGILVQNQGTETVTIPAKERIAQGVFNQVPRARWIPATELSDTARGTGGFGSTGTK